MPSDEEMVELLEKAGKKPEEIAEILGRETPPPPKDDELETIIFEVRGSQVVKIDKPKGEEESDDEQVG